MKQAEEKLFFHTPYIICDDWMLQQLQEVCSQVDQVCMMTNSVATNGNAFGAMDYQRYKGKILDTGVLHAWSMMAVFSYHGKCFAIDNRIASIVSFNWDMRGVPIWIQVNAGGGQSGGKWPAAGGKWRPEADTLKVVDEET